MKKIEILSLAGLLAAGSASAALVSTDFGSLADSDVTLSDLDSVTTGGTWSSVDAFLSNSKEEFILDSTGTNAAFLWEGGSGSQWWTRGALDFDETVDFSTSEASISYDMGWSYGGTDKELRLQGKDSSGATVFTLGWYGAFPADGGKSVDVLAGDPSARYMVDETAATNVSSDYAKDFGTGYTEYDPSGMGSFDLVLQGTDLTVTLGDGSTATITDLTTSNIASLEFGIRGSNSFTKEMWLDNISVVPEPGSFALIGGFLALTSVMLRRRR